MSSDCPVVTTQYGKVKGRTCDVVDHPSPVYVYYGIPYAAPPTGDQRFAPPQPAVSWDGIRDASKLGPMCPQNMEWTEECFQPVPIPKTFCNEDCLHVNVYTKDVNKGVNKPVMFYIHGGSFNKGTPYYYDGSAYVAYGDVVVVNVAYRLGAFGFLSTGDAECPGNNAFLDQIKALEWVRDNISQFGGDPGNVTIFGESAGAISVQILTLSPLAEGLFHKVISQSGGCVMPNVLPKDGPQRSFNLGKILGCDTKDSKELLQFLRCASVEDLIKAQNQLIAEGQLPSCCIDGSIITDDTKNLYRQGKFQKIPHLIGFNCNEGFYFANKYCPTFRDDDFDINHALGLLLKFSMLCYGAMGKEVFDAMKRLYFSIEEVGKMAEDQAYLRTVCAQSFGEMFISCPTWLVGEYHSKHASTYMYVYSHKPGFSRFPGPVSGATHEEELVLAWGDQFITNRPINEIARYTEEEKRLSRQMIEYWTNFAKTGNPNGAGLGDWPEFSPTSGRYLDLNCTINKVHTNFRSKHMEFWNHTVPQMIGEL